MTFSSDDLHRVMDHLRTHGVSCAACSSKELAVMDSPYIVHSVQDDGVRPGMGAPMILVRCKACSHAMLFATKPLGIEVQLVRPLME
jgi:hypothetical protein